MKSCKKLLAVLLALVMVFALAACGATETPGTKEPEKNIMDEIDGEWVTEFDLGEAICATLKKESDNAFKCDATLPVKMTYKFDKNGEFENEAELKDSDVEDAEKAFKFKLSGDELTFKKYVGEDADEILDQLEATGMELPWEFERQ